MEEVPRDRALRNTAIYLSKPRAITIYRNKLFSIRKVGFKPVI